MSGSWPELDGLLPVLGFVPSRTGSVITTVYGDAILPRGGSLALADLLVLMRRLGATDGVVRTAVSRLARDGVLRGRRTGRHSAYALTEAARAEFLAVVPTIYGPLDRGWDGSLHLAFPVDAAERAALEAASFAALTPGTMAGLDPAPPGFPTLVATGTAPDLHDLGSRAWADGGLAERFAAMIACFAPLADSDPPSPLDALAGRTVLIHAYRRLALKTPRLPDALRPAGWPGEEARSLCVTLYRRWAERAETWLDAADAGPGPLPRGPDPAARFSGGGRRPSGSAW